MAKNGRIWFWRLGVVGFLAVGGAIVFPENCALAQVIADGTLGAEGSTITPNINIGGLSADRIDGGATRGTNLFHSFLEFNVGNGQRVYFANPVGIENILSRVTGNNLSNILGTLGVDGGANLFFLNPNGIIFGPNAKLDIGGSFVASTADSVVFDNGFAFSATNPQAPPLLTISVPIGLQFGSKAGAIRVQASLSPGEPFTEIGDAGQLPATAQAVNTQPSGTALSSISGTLSNENDVDLFQIFLTGNQSFSATTVGSTASNLGGQLDTQLFLFNQDGSSIYVSDDVDNGVESYLPSGKPLTPTEPGLYYLAISSFNNDPRSTAGAMFFPTFPGSDSGPSLPKLPLSNWSNTGFDSGTYTIRLTGAQFTTTASVPGLAVRPGRTLALVGGDVLLDGVVLQAPGGRIELGGVRDSGMVGLNLDGNNLRLNFPNNIARADISLINAAELNVVAGNGGSIAFNARNIELLGRSELRAGISLRQGSINSQAGDITLNATGTIGVRQASLIENAVNPDAVGNGGNILITTGALVMTEPLSRSERDTELKASTSGKGNAGSVIVTAQDSISLDGSLVSISSEVEDGAIGNSSGINITTKTLSLSNGAELEASTRGQGNAGNVTIKASDSVIFDDGGIFSQGDSDLYTWSPQTVGNGGDINITTGSLTIINGGQINVESYNGQQGNAGNVTIVAHDTVFLRGSDKGYRSGIFSAARNDTIGSGGNINITTDSLLVTNGTRLDSSTAGRGNAGNVTIRANDMVSFDNSYAFSTVEAGASGNGGSINITTGSLSATNGFQLLALTRGQGNAGSVTIHANDTVSFDGVSREGLVSGAFSSVKSGASGNGGGVDITTGSLIVTNGARLDSSTAGRGNAGNVTIRANDIASFDNSYAFSTVEAGASGNGGSINITTGSLSATNGSQLLALTGGQGNAGSVTIRANDTVSFDGVSREGLVSGAFSSVGSSAVGNGGGVDLTTGSLSLTNDARLDSSTAGRGNAGNVTIHANDTVSFDNSDIFSTVEAGASGHGGSINITTGSLSATNSSQLLALTRGQGNAGSVTIHANDLVSFDSSHVFSTVEEGASGHGGNIAITTRTLSLTNGSEFLASTGGQGNAGNIIIRSDSVILSGVAPFPVLQDGRPGGFSSGLITNTNEGASGQGGNITVTVADLHILNGAVFSARSQSDFKAGNITINANTLEVTGGGQILSTAFSKGDAGNITVNVTDRTTISGSDPTFFDRFNQVAQVFGEPQAMYTIDPVGSESGLFANTVPGSTGKGGSIFINSNQVAISNGAQVAVDSQGQGNGGNINIHANSLTLNDRASIVAQTASGEGGNITLQVPDILLMRHNSLISAEAGGIGNGGSIDIDAGFIVAVPKEDSDIVANAYEGRGGNINITTQGIYGLEYRPQRTPLSDITASSEFGIAGEVAINTPGVDPSRGLAQLPTEVVHAEDLIDRRCSPSRGSDQRGSFTITGRGGLPPSPNDVLQNEDVITHWVTLPSDEQNHDRTSTNNKPTSSTPQPLVEAQSWVIGPDGQVILTADAPNVTPQHPWLPPPSCQDSRAGTQ